MAKRRRRRGGKGFVAIPIDGTLNLLTLAGATTILVDAFPAALEEDFYAISMDLNAQIINLTAGEGDPMTCGLAHGDYTAAQVEENLELTFLGPGSKLEQERSRRLVRKAGIFLSEVVNHTTMRLFGKTGSGQVRTKLKFVIQNGKNLSIWVHNKSGSALTTGSSLRFQGTVYGRWIL